MTSLPTKHHNNFKEIKAAELLSQHAKTTEGAIGMGRVLTEMKKALPHGEYTDWLWKHTRFSSTTSLRLRRSFAFATSNGDFENVRLEVTALYFCADRYDELSKAIPDPNQRAAIEAGLSAILKAAREHLVDEDAARTIYNKVALVKSAKLAKAMLAAAEVASADEPVAAVAVEAVSPDEASVSPAAAGPEETAPVAYCLTCEERKRAKETKRLIRGRMKVPKPFGRQVLKFR
jgi:hypothetical protein